MLKRGPWNLSSLLLTLLVLLACAFALLLFGEIDAYVEAFRGIDGRPLLWAVLLIPATQLFRAFRLLLFLRHVKVPSFAGLYRITCSHVVFNALLPARTGELSLPLLLNRYYGVEFSTGLGMLLLVRAYDLLVLLTIAAGILLVDGPRLTGIQYIQLFAGLAVVVLLLLAAAVPLAGTGLASALSQRLAHRRRLVQLLDNLARAMHLMRGSARLIRLFILTALVWMPLMLFFYFCSIAVDPSIALDQASLAGIAAVFAGAQPINSVAGVGTVEGGWVIVYSFLDVDWEVAVVSGLVMHATWFVALGLNLLLAFALERGPSMQPPPEGP